VDQLLFEIHRWQPSSIPQQDDITLVVVDVVQWPGKSVRDTTQFSIFIDLFQELVIWLTSGGWFR